MSVMHQVFCAGADIEEMNGWTAEQVVREQKFVEMTSVKVFLSVDYTRCL